MCRSICILRRELDGERFGALAFTLLNHYLDLRDAIEDQNGDNVDYNDFVNTDIPTEIALPEKPYLTVCSQCKYYSHSNKKSCRKRSTKRLKAGF